jgi:hypothetical protein
VPLTLGNGRAAGQFSLPAANPDDRKLIVQFVLTDTAGRVTASKPAPIVIPERPGLIAGLGEAPRSQTVARWSCEVNLDGGSKLTHQPGFSTLDLPGGTPMVNAPQYKLYNAPGALIRVDGDFAAAVRVTNDFDPGGEVVALANGRKLPFTFQGAGLLIWQDEKNFVRLERCKGSDGRLGLIHRVLIEVYKGGREAGIHYTPALPERPTVLGAIRKGGSLRLLFATGPDRLAVFQELAIDFNREVYVGVSAANLSKRPFQAKFEDFTLRGLDGKVVEVKPVTMTSLIESGAIRRADGTWVFEGALLKVVRSLGGPAQPQTNMDQFQGNWTDNRQLFWRAAKTGDALTLEMPVESSGTYEVRGKFTIAPDYAKFRFALDGKTLNQGKTTDLYNKEVRPARLMSLGSVALTKGKHQFTVTVLGKNPSSSGFNFGLDEIQLVPSR